MPEKILRVGLMKNGEMVAEKLVGRPMKIAVNLKLPYRGYLILENEQIPKDSWLIFTVNPRGHYLLNITDLMEGLVYNTEDFIPQSLTRIRSKFASSSGVCQFPLTDKHHGKILFGNFTMLFQFVEMPSKKPALTCVEQKQEQAGTKIIPFPMKREK